MPVLVHNYQDVNDKPKEDHHIATKYGNWSQKFKAIFDKYGFSMDDEANMVNLNHRGPHAREYHGFIWDLLQDFDEIANGDKASFIDLLKSLGEYLKSHNDLLYPFGWGR